jgi:hypothetical protein
MRRSLLPLVAAIAMIAAPADLGAQGRGGRAGGGPPQTGRAAAPEDLTGTWVAVVSEHWHLRMLVPPRGEFAMLPLNPEARKLAGAWDPAKEPAAEACKSYGAAAIMRVPGRFHISWADDNTMRMEIDSGMQTRLFRFGAAAAPAANQAPDWQGSSVASWESLGARGRGARPTQLKVTTTRMRPGYLRKNGVPYSANAVLEEYYDRFNEPNGDEWLIVTSIVTDPQYLTQPYATTNHFRKIPDKQGWDPTPCRADQAR